MVDFETREALRHMAGLLPPLAFPFISSQGQCRLSSKASLSSRISS